MVFLYRSTMLAYISTMRMSRGTVVTSVVTHACSDAAVIRATEKGRNDRNSGESKSTRRIDRSRSEQIHRKAVRDG